RPEVLTVKGSVRSKHLFAEFLGDAREARGSGLNDLTCRSIGVQHAAPKLGKHTQHVGLADGDRSRESDLQHRRLASVPLSKLIDVVCRDLADRESQLIGTRRDVPEHIAQFVLKFSPRFVVENAAMIALDLLNDVSDLTRLARQTKCRVFEVGKTARVKSGL